MASIEVCAADELTEGAIRTVDHNGIAILVCNSGGKIYALENRCSHQDTPLAGGRVRRGFIACPLHGVMFDLKTGMPRGELTKKPVQTYETEVRDNRVFVFTDP